MGFRGLTWPSLIGGVAWFASAGLAWWASQWMGKPITICLLKRVTGKPCPTCGGTRAGVFLLRGQVSDAFTMNPLVTAFLMVFPLWLVWRLVRARATPWPRYTRAAVVAMLALNWAYVLWRNWSVGEP